jgi:hypothetical protein
MDRDDLIYFLAAGTLIFVTCMALKAKACDHPCDIMYAQLMSITTSQHGSVEQVCANPRDRRVAKACGDFERACGE